MFKHKLESGLTFIELLITLSIIVMSIAILLPIFHPSDKNSMRCYSNMRQIGTALIMYQQDNNDRLPPLYSTTVRRKRITWRLLVYRYIGDRKVYKCPANNKNSLYDVEKDGFYRSYTLNACSAAGNKFGGLYAGMKLHNYLEVSYPETTILMLETTSGEAGFDILNPKKIVDKDHKVLSYEGLSIAHKSEANFLFVDGHVETLNPITTLYKPDTKANLWTNDNVPFSRELYDKALQTINNSR